MRKAANLRDEIPLIVWLAPASEDYESGRFLEQAQDLIAGESYGLAVVASQIHFEVHLRELLKEAVRKEAPRWAKRLLEDRGIAELKRAPSLAAVELLLGIDVTQLAEWPRFQAHVDRRNDAVHRGQAVEKEHAEDSVAVVQELWVRLASAARDV